MNGPVTYKVTGQMPASGPDGRGGFGNGIEVHFELSTGGRSSVFVPMPVYQAGGAKELLLEHAGQLAALEGDTGTVTPA